MDTTKDTTASCARSARAAAPTAPAAASVAAPVGSAGESSKHLLCFRRERVDGRAVVVVFALLRPPLCRRAPASSSPSPGRARGRRLPRRGARSRARERWFESNDSFAFTAPKLRFLLRACHLRDSLVARLKHRRARVAVGAHMPRVSLVSRVASQAGRGAVVHGGRGVMILPRGRIQLLLVLLTMMAVPSGTSRTMRLGASPLGHAVLRRASPGSCRHRAKGQELRFTIRRRRLFGELRCACGGRCVDGRMTDRWIDGTHAARGRIRNAPTRGRD